MLLGLDVGGTFTDAVVIDKGHIVQSHKCRTTKPNLLEGIEAALAGVAQAIEPSRVTRITLSTTIVTNALVMNQVEPVDLYIVPGPGMDIRSLLPVEPIVLDGYTDHRGSLVAPLKPKALETLSGAKRYKRAAVSAKFAVRNPSLEQKLAAALYETGYESVSAGAQLSGSLNFPRRTISAYFNSAVQGTFQNFAEAVRGALQRYGLTAPIYILKADGGSLPLAHMQDCPVETAFTGPAASVLGMAALQAMPKAMTIALDMGGTTTDISLWQDGKPLMARGGAMIQSYPSAVRSFAVSSVGIGGESAVTLDEKGQLQVGPERVGPSMALGGTVPTLGDALIVLGKAKYGDVAKAESGLSDLATEWAESEALHVSEEALVIALAQAIVEKAVAIIVAGIDLEVSRENKLPIYVVRDIVEPSLFKATQLVAVGGTAASLAPLVAATLKLPLEIPTNAPVANAVGAAVAKETLMVTVHLDTAKRVLVVPELGIHETNSTIHTAEEVEQLALRYLAEAGAHLGLSNAAEGHIVAVEDVPIIEGWQSMHRLITVKAQLEPGVSLYVK